MRKLILAMSISLDGFVGGPNGENDWIFRSGDEAAASSFADVFQQAGLIAMGSRSFFGMAGFWPTATGVFAQPMNEVPKIVFTGQASLTLGEGHTPMTVRDLTQAEEARRQTPVPDPSPAEISWATARIANGDLGEEVQRLKEEEGKDIVALGGAGFARSLVRLGLVDEYRLKVHPVALGAGLSLFSELPHPQDLKLVSTSLFRSGVAIHVYRPA